MKLLDYTRFASRELHNFFLNRYFGHVTCITFKMRLSCIMHNRINIALLLYIYAIIDCFDIIIQLENTYRLEPLMSFRSSRAEEIIRSVFRDIFASVSDYPDKPEETHHLVKMAANEIRNRTRMLNYDRYKIVVLVNIGQRAGQSVRVVSRCLWAVTVDTWASATYEARNLFAVGTVFAIYTA